MSSEEKELQVLEVLDEVLVSVNDYTNFSELAKALTFFALQVSEFIVWTVINTFILSLFLIACIVGFISKLLGGVLLVNWINSHYPLILNKENLGSLSSISVAVPTLYNDFEFDANVLLDGASHDNDTQQQLDEVEPFDPAKALALVHLSCLTYESLSVVKAVSRHWGFEFRQTALVSCVCYIFYNVEKRLVVVAFKGTSPFNLTEWLSDAIMSKVRPQWKYDLPGLVHQGIYNALFVPADDRYEAVMTDLDAVFQKINGCTPNQEAASSNTPSIQLWVTGHSLGAGLSAILFSYWLTQKDFKWMKGLRGVYGFGTPRCGDSDYAQQAEKLRKKFNKPYYRVVNANDVICNLPFGAQATHTTQHIAWILDLGPLSTRPQGALNYQHYGHPILLNYHDPTYHHRDPLWSDTFSNMGCWFSDILSNFTCGSATWYLRISRLFTPNFIADHYPSEYIRHLNALGGTHHLKTS